MVSDWISNINASKQVKALLDQAGVPLELQVAEICRAFCASHPAPPITSEPIVYGSSEGESKYREIDQRVLIYEEFEVSKHLGVQLIFQIPIECKYRKDIELFSFGLGDKNLFRRFPIYRGLKGSVLFDSVYQSYTRLAELRPSRIALLEIKDGKTVSKLYDEQLIYNAAGALYDYVIFDLGGPEQEQHASESEGMSPKNVVRESDPAARQIMKELGLYRPFADYLTDAIPDWKHVIQNWISQISATKRKQYNRRYLPKTAYYAPLFAYLPVVCVNGPIYQVSWALESGIQTFEEIPYCITSIRKVGWPPADSYGLLSLAPELPAIVTNAFHLGSALELGYAWYAEIRRILTTFSAEVVETAALQAGFYQLFEESMVERFHTLRPGAHTYRSDLHTEYC